MFTRFPALARKAADKVEAITYNSSPWTPVTKPLSQLRIALVTTAGVHLLSDVPFDMTDSTGDASFRVAPSSTAADKIMITHDYYNHSDADKDINIVFPIDRLKELVAQNVVGSLSERFFGFMGHIEGKHLDTLINDSIPRIARMMKEDGADAAFITPG